MRKLIHLARSNALPRLAVGTLVVVFLYQGMVGQKPDQDAHVAQLLPLAQATAEDDVPAVSDATLQNLARTDHMALMKWSLQHYLSRVQDFTGVFHKQERINGKLMPEQVIQVQFKQSPFSVLMQWQENAGSIDKLLYVEGSNDDQMIVHPTGLLSWIKSVKRDPRCAEVKQSSRKTCDQFGFERTLQSMLDVYNAAEEAGDLETNYLGETFVYDRPCVAVERVLPPGKDYPSGRMIVEYDLEHGLPVGISSYDWQGNLLSRYAYSELNFNVGLTSEQFTPGHNGL